VNEDPTTRIPLRGARILLVEDDMLVSVLLEDMLMDLGCEVLGPVGHLEEAVDLASVETIDAALLDLSVNGKEVYPVATILAERGIPFAFVTGYDAGGIGMIYRERPTLQKPFRSAALERILKGMLSRPVC
jgi:DNA-binding response OmpR family regulator